MITYVDRYVNPAPIFGNKFEGKQGQTKEEGNDTKSKIVKDDGVNGVMYLTNNDNIKYDFLSLFGSIVYLNRTFLVGIWYSLEMELILPLFRDKGHTKMRSYRVLQTNHKS